jgi:exopolyphosphatase/guanosine-5'-triphosphate,3'-diphosphate pyrophosphatase
MIRSSIDLGTNTCLLLVADWDPLHKKVQKILGDYSAVVRLGEGVDLNRELQTGAMDRTLKCLKDYAKKVRDAGGSPEQTLCVGTSQARDAQNSASFFSKVQKETGFSFQVISGEEEARLTFLGALLPGMDPRSSAVIDIGGGSTELISFDQAQSLDMGAVRFTERFLKSDPVTDPEFWACQDAVDEALQSWISWRDKAPHLNLVAVAGTATTLAAWYLDLKAFDPKQVDEVVLSRGDVHRMVEELKWRSVKERRNLPAMEALRADVILAGAIILWRTMELLHFSECRVSTRGLRYGILNNTL